MNKEHIEQCLLHPKNNTSKKCLACVTCGKSVCYCLRCKHETLLTTARIQANATQARREARDTVEQRIRANTLSAYFDASNLLIDEVNLEDINF